MIPHHEHPVLGNGDPELHRRRLDHLTVLRVQVGTLVKGFPVDGHLTLDVAAGNGVAGHSDNAFDEVAGARVGQQTHELQHFARDRATILGCGKPVLGVLGHDAIGSPSRLVVIRHGDTSPSYLPGTSRQVPTCSVTNVQNTLWSPRRASIDPDLIRHTKTGPRTSETPLL